MTAELDKRVADCARKMVRLQVRIKEAQSGPKLWRKIINELKKECERLCHLYPVD
jgi:hypothetical protein